MAIATLKMITLDSSDARRDAAFWSTVLGYAVAHVQDEYAMLTGPGGVALGLGTLADHEPPGWPNEHGSKQFHLDLAVDDLDAAAREVVGLGGTLPDEQPGETWRVLLDPSGHPFCLTRAANWG
jgi:predicted enzyme related to lactoylglutathione lyase